MEEKEDLRKKIIYLHKKGEGYKKISKALLISQNIVAKVVQTFKKDGTATISQRRPGCPRKLTPRQERPLMKWVEENRHTSSLQLSKEVESQTGVTISHDTIRRTLQRNGMHGCRPRKKPLLKPMSAAGVRELHFIDGIINSQMYCSILKEKIQPHSVPLVVVHFSNMTMILNTHLRPLLDFWRRTGWKWFSGQVCLLIWTQSNTYGEFWRDKLSIILHPASNL